MQKMVRIRYWRQDTLEAGHYVLSCLMLLDNALKLLDLHIYERAEIVEDSEGK